jgi:RNA 2',3'-cyclic 3'-phosphodiesterase
MPALSNRDPARLFVAISIPKDVRSMLVSVQDQFRSLTDQFSLTHRENLHLTLVFLGSTPASILNPLRDTIRSVAKTVQPFSISIVEHGAFPRLEKARIVYQNIEANGPALLRLQETLSARLSSRFNFNIDDREYHPHITLGRIKKKFSSANITTWTIDTPPIQSFAVDSITLFESHFTQGKLTYSPVEEFSLG